MRPVLLILAILVTVVACQKASNPTPPPTQPVTPDTAYLLKTDTIFYYDPSGTRPIDTSLAFWTYDDKRRPTRTIVISPDQGTNDTIWHTYGTNQNFTRSVVYVKGILDLSATQTDYIGFNGRIDSSLNTSSSGTNNAGVWVYSKDTGFTVNYFDRNGNDSLSINYQVDSGYRYLNGKTYNTWSGNSLVYSYLNNRSNQKSSSERFENGNEIADTIFNLSMGGLTLAVQYTYSATSAGGFYSYNGNKNLVASFSGYTPGGPLGGSYEYTFDSANRVRTVTQKNTAGVMVNKGFYTYY